MKSKVILFCALLFCSKFVESVPLGEETVRQRAYNWQGSQNTAEYHGSDFTRTQNVNSMTNAAHGLNQYENGQEQNLNQGAQQYENFGYNNQPPTLQSLPVKESSGIFAPDTIDQRPGFISKGNPYSIRTDNRPIRVDNQQYRPQNWQSQGRYINSAQSASGTAISGLDRPVMTVQEPYPGSSQLYQGNVNQPHYHSDGSYQIARDHYHPVAEQPGNVRYVEHAEANSASRNRPVRYENYNEPHAAHLYNNNMPKPGNNRYHEHSPLSPRPANFQHLPNRPIPGSSNVASTYNDGRANPTNWNKRYETWKNFHTRPNHPAPPTYAVPIVPPNTAIDNIDNTRYVENPGINSGPQDIAPLNSYSYSESSGSNLEPDGQSPNTYIAPVVPEDSVYDQNVNRYLENAGSSNPEPNYDVMPVEPTVIDSSNTGSDNNPLLPNDNEGVVPLVHKPLDYNHKPEDIYSVPGIPVSRPNNFNAPGDSNPYQNSNQQFPPGSDQAILRDLFNGKKSKNYVILHPNGTIEHVHNLKRDRPSYKVHKPVGANDNQTPSPPLAPVINPDQADDQPNQNNFDWFSDKTDYNSPPASDNDNDQSPELNNDNQSSTPRPATENDYSSPQGSQPENVNDYNAPPEIQSSSDNDYKSPTGPLIPNHYPYKPSSGSQNPTGHHYYPPVYPNNDNDYYPRNPQWENGYMTSPSVLHTHISPDILTSTTPAPDDGIYSHHKRPLHPHGNKHYPPSGPVYSNHDNYYRPHHTKWDNTLPSKLHTHISPDIFTSTTPAPDDGVNKKHPNPNENKHHKPGSVHNNNDNDYNPHHSKWDNAHTPPPSKLHTHISPGIFTSTTPTPDDGEHHKTKDHKHYTPRPVHKNNDNDYNPHHSKWDNAHTTPPSKLHTHISPGIFTSTTPAPDDGEHHKPKDNKHYTPSWWDKTHTTPKSKFHTHISPGHSSTTAAPSHEVTKKKLGPRSPHGHMHHTTPGPVHKNNDNDYHPHHPKWDKTHTTPPSKLHTHISPGIFTSTTPAPDDGIDKKDFDQFSDQTDDNVPIYNGGSNFEWTNIDNESDDNNPSEPIENTSKLHPHTKPNEASATTTVSPESEDLLIKKFLDSFSTKDYYNTSPAPRSPSKNDYAIAPSPIGYDTSSPPNSVTTSPEEEDLNDQIITLSPIETATDNVRDVSTPCPSDEEAPVYDKQDETDNGTSSSYESFKSEYQKSYNTTASSSSSSVTTQDSDKIDDSLPKNTNNGTDDQFISDDHKSASNDTLTNTDAPAELDDNSAVATNTTQCDSGDTSTSGDNLTESMPPTSDLTITLSIPNDPNGTLIINLEVPDSTGDEDSGDTLVLSINTKNSSESYSATSTKKSANSSSYEDRYHEHDEHEHLNQNMMFDLSNALIVMNRTSDRDYFNQLLSNNGSLNMFVFQMPPQEEQIIEKNKEIIIYPNHTICETTVTTVWKHKDDPSPTVETTRRIYHDDKGKY